VGDFWIGFELDHVLVAVVDLAKAARELEARYGLSSIEGGRHAGWGTANRIVPLGNSYLELISVVDEAEAERTAFGTWVAQARPLLAKPLGWAVRTGNLDDVARRLGLVAAAGSRATRTGELLQWRLAGVERAAAEPSLPFFIEWHEDAVFPGRASRSAPAEAQPVVVRRLELDGDPQRLAAWLGEHRLPIAVNAGRPALRRLVLDGPCGEIVLE